MRKLFSLFTFLMFLFVAIAFIGAIISTVISPKLSWPFAFLGLGYPILFVMLLLITIIWLISRKKKVIYPLLLLGIGLLAHPNSFNFKGKTTTNNNENSTLKIMSYNVRNFEVYDKANRQQKRDEIIKLIQKESPDILCLQEAHQSKKHISLDKLTQDINLKDYHFEVGTTSKSGGQFGVAVFSKYPIHSTSSFQFGSGGNVGTKVNIIAEDTISVFNIHLESANIEDRYYAYSKEREKISKKTYIQRARRVAGQLKSAYINRSDQARVIRKEIQKTTHPVIVCGDFNDTPVSYAYAKVKGRLQDAFKYGKTGFGETYPEIPFLRIDHIFVSKQFQVNDYKIQKEKISDHYPVITTVQLKE